MKKTEVDFFQFQSFFISATPQHKRPEFIPAHKSTDFKEKTDYRNSY